MENARAPQHWTSTRCHASRLNLRSRLTLAQTKEMRVEDGRDDETEEAEGADTLPTQLGRVRLVVGLDQLAHMFKQFTQLTATQTPH